MTEETTLESYLLRHSAAGCIAHTVNVLLDADLEGHPIIVLSPMYDDPHHELMPVRLIIDTSERSYAVRNNFLWAAHPELFWEIE